MATPGLGIARVHKVLHHKRPRLVPLLDIETVKPIRAAADASAFGSWQLIHDEIHAHAEHFQTLAGEFGKLAAGIGDVSLSWLRLYDILVWMLPSWWSGVPGSGGKCTMPSTTFFFPSEVNSRISCPLAAGRVTPAPPNGVALKPFPAGTLSSHAARMAVSAARPSAPPCHATPARPPH